MKGSALFYSSIVCLLAITAAALTGQADAHAQSFYIDEEELQALQDTIQNDAIPQAREGVTTTHSAMYHLVKAFIHDVDETLLNIIVIVVTFLVIVMVASRVSSHAFKITMILFTVGFVGFMLIPFIAGQ